MSKRERLLFAITNNVNYLADLHKKNGVMFNKIKQELIRRKTSPEPLRDGIYDLQLKMEKIAGEMEVIKKLLEEKKSGQD